MNMVNSVDTNNPPIIVAAIPANIASPNRGSIPKMVVPDAIVTGTIRVLVASITALTGITPLLNCKSISSTKTIAFLIFIPINPNYPKIAKKSSDLPNKSNPSTTPIKIRGNIHMISTGFL